MRAHNTALLRRARTGDAAACSDLLELTYEALRNLASRFMGSERRDHTLQPTALVHEAYLELVDADSIEWQDRDHFIATAACAMRRVLLHHARRKSAKKRGGGWKRTYLEDHLAVSGKRMLDVLSLEEALTRLQVLDERRARVVELRFFGGLTIEEAARVLGVSTRTVEDEWYSARAWLLRELEEGDAAP